MCCSFVVGVASFNTFATLSQAILNDRDFRPLVHSFDIIDDTHNINGLKSSIDDMMSHSRKQEIEASGEDVNLLLSPSGSGDANLGIVHYVQTRKILKMGDWNTLETTTKISPEA